MPAIALDKPIDREATLREIRARKLEIESEVFEASLYDFTVAAWPHIDSAPFAHGGYALQAICEHLEAAADGYIQNLLINVPPRFSKSTVVGTMFPAWVWAQQANTMLLGPGAQFLCAGYALTLSLQDSVKCRALIQSDWYQAHWGHRFKLLGDVNTKTRFQTDKNGARIAVSVGGSTTGLGGSYLIGDDLNNAAEANSEAMLEGAINWWNTAWYNRLNNSKPGQGCRIVVAQRLNERDISGHVLEQQVGDWTHLCLPMRYEPDRSFHTVLVPAEESEDGEPILWKDPRTVPGELLWPERFDDEQVKQLEKTLGPYAAAGQLQQRPEPAGGGVIKREHWLLWNDPVFPPLSYVIASLDTAYTTKQENDYSALTIWGVFAGDANARSTLNVDRYGKRMEMPTAQYSSELDAVPKIILMYAFQERLEINDLVLRVAKVCKDYKVDKLLIEGKASGISVSQELRRLFGHEDFAVQLINPGNLDKLARLHSISHLFAEGMVYAPDKEWAEMVINQVAIFPKGKNDDLVDSTSQSVRHLRDLGLLTRSPERLAEIDQSKDYSAHKTPPPLYGI
jgi:predicted phage terminase large subunit-like protein